MTFSSFVVLSDIQREVTQILLDYIVMALKLESDLGEEVFTSSGIFKSRFLDYFRFRKVKSWPATKSDLGRMLFM